MPLKRVGMLVIKGDVPEKLTWQDYKFLRAPRPEQSAGPAQRGTPEVPVPGLAQKPLELNLLPLGLVCRGH